jgi:hypothetical protein
MPAASAFLKNLTMPNILFKSVKATAGIFNFCEFSMISLILSNPLEILNSDETLR